MKQKSKFIEFDTGDKVANYVILEKIDGSSVYTTYTAVEPALNRHVAFRVLHGPYITDIAELQKFKGKARKLVELRHKHTISIYNIAFEEGVYYVVTDYVLGYNLQDWLNADRVFDPEAAMRFVMGITSALEYASKDEIFHLHINPVNCVVNWDNIFLISNLGVTQCRNLLIGAERYDALANPHYISPEQISGKPTDHRTDIYSLGATLFHLMTGTPPFEAETSDGVCLAHLQEPFPEKKAREAEVPDGWIDLMSKMMEKEPSKRFQSYQDIGSALLMLA